MSFYAGAVEPNYKKTPLTHPQSIPELQIALILFAGLLRYQLVRHLFQPRYNTAECNLVCIFGIPQALGLWVTLNHQDLDPAKTCCCSFSNVFFGRFERHSYILLHLATEVSAVGRDSVNKVCHIYWCVITIFLLCIDSLVQIQFEES